MDETLKVIGSYLATQGPWAGVCAIVFYGIYKFAGRILDVLDRNTSAFARVEAVMDKVLERL